MSKINRPPFQSNELPEFDGFSNDLLYELKVRARLRLNALHADDPAVAGYAHFISRRRRWSASLTSKDWKLQHALNLVAAEVGFRDWNSARTMLSGTMKSSGDHGGFWHARSCEPLLNHWFANYSDAKACQRPRTDRWLFPYQRQFVVVDAHYVKALSLDPDSPLWEQAQFDLARSYGSAAWYKLCTARLNVTKDRLPSTFGQL
jgi:hypothetical protein